MGDRRDDPRFTLDRLRRRLDDIIRDLSREVDDVLEDPGVREAMRQEKTPTLSRVESNGSAYVLVRLDRDRFRPLEHTQLRAQLSRELGFLVPDNAPLLVCVGALIERKGQDIAIAALPRIEGAWLVLVGNGDDAAKRRLLLAGGLQAQQGLRLRLPEKRFFGRNCCRVMTRRTLRVASQGRKSHLLQSMMDRENTHAWTYKTQPYLQL